MARLDTCGDVEEEGPGLPSVGDLRSITNIAVLTARVTWPGREVIPIKEHERRLMALVIAVSGANECHCQIHLPLLGHSHMLPRYFLDIVMHNGLFHALCGPF